MSIIESQGDLLRADADALVNTVNCVGVMGKGIALQFKRQYPDMFDAYKRACERGEVQVGRMWVWETGLLDVPRYIINFPTKKHWKGGSQLPWIKAGLADLRRVIADLGIRSVALPPLGAGNGGLNWADVEPLIREALGGLVEDIVLFPPTQAYRAVQATQRIQMSRTRALVLMLMGRYGGKRELIEPWLDTRGVSHLEVQKLMYFAEVLAPVLELSFQPGRYGPYSDKVRLVLQGMEGRYTSGFGDGSASALSLDPIQVTAEGERELARYLASDAGREVDDLAARVLTLTDGYEDPYGVELLASTWYVAHTQPSQDPAAIAQGVRSWTKRKGKIFTDQHVSAALRHFEAVALAV